MIAVEGTSKLWPVLTALVLMPVVAIAVEQLALHRGGTERVIRVDAAHSTEGDDVDVAASVATSPEHEVARAQIKQGNLAAAVKLFAPLAVASPESAAIAFEYGAALVANQEPEEGIVQLQRAKTLAPNDPRVAVLLARTFVKRKDNAAAEAELQRALTVRPGYGSALRSLGRLYTSTGRTKEAVEVLTQASQFGSNEERATSLVALGGVLLEAGRVEDGRLAFEQAIERAPAQVEIRLGVARAFLGTDKKEDVTRASGVLAVAADLAPDLPDVQTLIGQVREASSDLDGAEEAYWQAIRLAPQSLFPRRRLLRLALDRQRFTKAQQQSEELLSIDSTEPEHHFLAGLVASRQGDNKGARAHYLTAIAKNDGDYPEAYLNLGSVEKDEKNLDAAIVAYQTAIAQRPGYHAAENNLGLALVASAREADAEKLYRDVLARAPTYAPAWVNLGKLYSGQKKYPEAIDAYQKALEVKPDYARALLDLGVAYARSGRVDDAIGAYGKVIALNPRSVAATYNLGLVQAQKGDQEAAAATWRKALEIEPDHVPSARKLAASFASRGNDAEAQKLYEDVLDAEPRDVDARIALATLFQKAGNPTACEREASVARANVGKGADGDAQRAALTELERTCATTKEKP